MRSFKLNFAKILMEDVRVCEKSLQSLPTQSNLISIIIIALEFAYIDTLRGWRKSVDIDESI